MAQPETNQPFLRVQPRPEAIEGSHAEPIQAVARPRLSSNESRDSLLRRMLATGDVLAVLFGSLSLGFLGGSNVSALFWSIALIPVWLLLATILGLYERDQRSIRHLTVDETPLLAIWVLLVTTSVALFLYSATLTQLSLADGARFVLVLFVASVALRSLSRRLWRGVTPTERTVIIGSGHLASSTHAMMNLFPDVHIEVVAFYPELEIQTEGEGSDWWLSIDRIIIAKPVDESHMKAITALGRRRRIKVGIIPPDCSLSGTAVHLDRVPELSIVEYRAREVTRSTLLIKRAFDIVFGAFLLTLSAPFAALIALAIRLDSPGSPIYVQRRVGLKGRSFRMFKFRTMVRDAEQQLEKLVAIGSLPEPVFKLQDDPRVTRVGHLLRRWSLDELPQLINVAVGQMSLVGPRPEQVEIVERYTDAQRIRLQVRPGLTGPMQVYGRGDLNFEERLAVERDYIENLSLRRDLHILRRTVAAVIGGRGAF